MDRREFPSNAASPGFECVGGGGASRVVTGGTQQNLTTPDTLTRMLLSPSNPDAMTEEEEGGSTVHSVRRSRAKGLWLHYQCLAKLSTF